MEERGFYNVAGPIGERPALQRRGVGGGRHQMGYFRRDNSGLRGQLGELAAVLRAGLAGNPLRALWNSLFAAVAATGTTLFGMAATGAAGKFRP